LEVVIAMESISQLMSRLEQVLDKESKVRDAKEVVECLVKEGVEERVSRDEMAEVYPEGFVRDGRSVVCACCVFRRDCRVYLKCLQEGGYQYRSWKEYHLQYQKCKEGMRLWEEADRERERWEEAKRRHRLVCPGMEDCPECKRIKENLRFWRERMEGFKGE